MWIPLREFDRHINTDILDTPIVDLIEALREKDFSDLLFLVTSRKMPWIATVPYEKYGGLSPAIYINFWQGEFEIGYMPTPLPKYRNKPAVSCSRKLRSITKAVEYIDLLMIRAQHDVLTAPDNHNKRL